jgi:hypothetical protein
VAACRQAGSARPQACPAYAVTTAVAQVGWVTLLLVRHVRQQKGVQCVSPHANTSPGRPPTPRPSAVTRGSGALDPIRVVRGISNKR